MAKRLALVVALAVTVVVGSILLTLGAVDFGSGGGATSGTEVAPVTTEVAAAEQPTQSSGSSATPLPSSEQGEQRSRETADDHGREREREGDEDGEHEDDD